MIDNISNFIAELQIDGKIFCDLFTGSASVADHFKDKYQIIANDLLSSSYTFATAKINFGKVPSFKKFKDEKGIDPFSYFTNKEYDNNLKLQRYQTQEKMIKNNLAIMESISSKIVDIEHKMKYLLMNIKYSAIRNDVKDIVKIIDENLWTINKTRYFINTNNPYFDNLFAAVIKKFHQKNISPIIVCEVKKGALDRNIYMTSLFVEMIEQIVELSDESNQIQITIHSTANSIIFSVILSGIDENFDHKLSIDYKELKENDIHYSCHYINCSTLEIKFLFFEVNS